jgi:hypothetical protein
MVVLPNTKTIELGNIYQRLGGASSGMFFSKPSACCNYTFGPRALNALAPSNSSFNMPPSWQLG